MLHKIREALRQRDLQYKLNKYIELDGASFGKKVTGNQVEVLVAIETSIKSVGVLSQILAKIFCLYPVMSSE